MNIILASQSPRREELMHYLTDDFRIIPSDFPEREVIFQGDGPAYTRELALKKAHQVAVDHRDALVIGSDTVVMINGALLNKPQDLPDARRMIALLQGTSHEVVTSYALVCLDRSIERVGHVATEVTFHPMSGPEIEAYLATGDHAGKAGAYAIQGAAARYVKGIRGDFYTVVGLPVAELYRELKALGALGVDDLPSMGASKGSR